MTRSPRGYAAIWIATLLFFGGFYALLVPLPRYLASVGLADWQIGVVLGAFGVASLLGRPIVGATVDRIGARPVLLAGVAALLAGALGVPLARGMAALLVLRLLQAAGYVAFTTAGTALVAQLTPPAQRTSRLALFGIAANVAITLAPAAMSALLAVVPLTSAFVLAAGLVLPAGLLVACVPGLPGAAALPPAGVAWRPPRVLWRPMLLSALFGAGFAAFFQFAPILAERRGALSAGWMYSAYGVAIVGTRLAGSRLLGRAAPWRVMGGAAAAMALGLLLIAAAPPAAGVLGAVLLIACASGVLHPMLLAEHIALLPGAPGQAAAAFYIGFDLGIGLGSWMFGVVLQAAGIGGLYTVAALVVALMLLPLAGVRPAATR